MYPGLKFSFDGKHMIVGRSTGLVHYVDSFTGDVRGTMSTYSSNGLSFTSISLALPVYEYVYPFGLACLRVYLWPCLLMSMYTLPV